MMTERHALRRLPLIAAALIVVIAVAVPIGLIANAALSGANASDAELIGLNRLGAATLDIEVGAEGGAAGSTDAALRAENLAPGDRATGKIELRNAGSLPLRYSLRVVTDGDPLAQWLVFDLLSTSSGCDAGVDAATEVIRTGIVLATEDVVLVGDPSTGFQPGDRRLAPDATEVICIGATLPIATPNDAQGRALAFDLIVDAEHDLDEDTP
jgi:hypothetical protein